MLEILKNTFKRVQKLSSNKILKDIFDDSDLRLDMVNLNRSQMRDDGVDALGDSLGDYSPISVSKYGKEAGHIQLYDTGYFQGSMKALSLKEAVVIEADMKKPDVDLEIIYPHALGLTDENTKIIQGLVEPIFKEKVLQEVLQ